VALKRQLPPIEIHSKTLPGRLDATTPDGADPCQYDLVCLAMQDAQYRGPQVRELMCRVTASGKPILSIMNLPPLPYLARIPTLDPAAVEFCYADPRIWDGFVPGRFTQASADPQAFRQPELPVNVLQVTLATNFRVARFDDQVHTAMLLDLQSAIESARFDLGDRNLSEVPVKLTVHDSAFVPLRKWSMLLTGNYRCIQADGIRSIREAVHSDLEVSRAIYDWVNDVLLAMGAQRSDLVPFYHYAKAALVLVEPSSVVRALAADATAIERVDLLVQSIAASKGMRNRSVDAITELVNFSLMRNRDLAREIEAATASMPSPGDPS
jgi:hypothetical protein